MPVDISLVKHTLAVLANLGGVSLPEDTLAAEIEIRACRPLTTQQVRDTIIECRRIGWLATRKDDFGRDVWWITDAGLNKHATFA